MLDRRTRTVDPSELEALLQPLLLSGAEIPLQVTGSSMVPFLASDRDSVLLGPIDRPLRRGDIILYRRTGGDWVLHRIVRIDGCKLHLLGDAQTELEKNIDPQQAAALVRSVRRKGKTLRPGNPVWLFYQTLWLWLRPLRPALMHLAQRRAGA